MHFTLAHGVEATHDVDVSADHGDVTLTRQHIAAHDIQRASGIDQHIPSYAADRAAGIEPSLGIHPVRRLARSITDTAQCAKTGFLDFFVLVLVGRILFRDDVDVTVCGHDQVPLCGHVGTDHVQIPPSHHHGAIAGEGGGHRLGPGRFLDAVRRLAGEEPFRLVIDLVIRIPAGIPRQHIDVAPRTHRQLLVGRHLGRNGIDVLRSHQRQISGSGNAGSHVFRRSHLRPVLLAEVERLAIARPRSGQVDIVAGANARVTAGDDGGGLRVDVAARLRIQRSGVDTGNPVDDGVADSATHVRLGAGREVDVAARGQRDAVTLEQPSQVVDVVARIQVDGLALDRAHGVAHVLRIDHQRVARANGAAVVHVARRADLRVATGDQRAITAQVARLDGQVDLRGQHLLLRAVGQRDGLLHHPDDVAGQVAHLLFGERGAHGQAELVGEVGACRQQRLVLGFVVGVVADKALAGGQHHLLGHQLLLVEAVAQALEDVARVLVQFLEQEIAGYHGARTDELAVGGDQIRRVGRRDDLVQLAGRDGRRQHHDGNGLVAGQRDARQRRRRQRLDHGAGPRRRDGRRDRDAALGIAQAGLDAFGQDGGVVVGTVVLAGVVLLVGVGHGADTVDRAQPLGADVAQRAALRFQGAASEDSALVVDDVARQAGIAAYDDLAWIALGDAGLARDLGHLIEGEVLDHAAAAEVGVEGLDLLVQRVVQLQVVIVLGLLLGQVVGAAPTATVGRRRPPDAAGAFHFEYGPDLGVRLVEELSGVGIAIAGVAATAVIGFGNVRQADRRADSRAALLVFLDVAVVERRPVLAFRITRRRHQQAPLIVLPHPARVAPADGLDGVAEPHAFAIDDVGGAVQAIEPLGFAADLDGFAGEVQVAVLDAGRGDVGVALDFDGGGLVGQQRGLAGGLAGGVQRAAQPQVARGVDQRVLAIGQRAHAQVHVAARGDDGIGFVLQQRRLDADAIAVDAAGVEKIAGVDECVAAVDQAGVAQQAADDQFVVAHRDQFAAGAVGQRIGGDLQVLARVDLAVVVEVAGDQLQRGAGGQGAAGVGDAAEGELRIGVGRDVAARIVERTGGQGQVLASADAASLVVDGSGVQHDLLAHQAQGARGRAAGAGDAVGESVAVLQAAGRQRQRVVGLDQAGAVVQRALRLEREAAGRDDAASVGQALCAQRGLPLRGDGAAGIVDRADGLQVQFATAGDLAAAVGETCRVDADSAAIQAA